ncbi:T9SS type A sorting domain-containing protein [Flavobacterium sp.]
MHNGNAVNVTDLQSGIYFVKILVNNQVIIRKFIKK